MFTLRDGREHLYQWDIDRQIVVEDESITQVHFCNRTDDCSLVVEVKTEDNIRVANIPNILLQDSWNIRVYAYCNCYTKIEEVFKVKPRTKPSDYVYTETEILSIEKVEKRVEELSDTKLDKVTTSGSRRVYSIGADGGQATTILDYRVKTDSSARYQIAVRDSETTNDFGQIRVPLTPIRSSHATSKEYVDTAIYDSKDSYYIKLSNIPLGEENAVTASEEVVEFATRFVEDRNVCLHFQDSDGLTNPGYKNASISYLTNKITFKDATIDIAKIAGNNQTTYYTYTLKLNGTEWVIYRTAIGAFTLTTKEYVDGLFANIATAEGGSY